MAWPVSDTRPYRAIGYRPGATNKAKASDAAKIRIMHIAKRAEDAERVTGEGKRRRPGH